MHSTSPALIVPHAPDALPEPDSEELLRLSRSDAASVLAALETTESGLLDSQAAARLAALGANIVGHAPGSTILEELAGRANNPLNLLLLGLAGLSYFLGDVRAAIIIAVMVVLAIGTAFLQEHRSNQAAAKLRAMVKNSASVKRQGAGSEVPFADVPLEQIVPGDIVRLSAGDMLPGDMRLLSANDLFVNQAALTGESMPCEKSAECRVSTAANILDLPNIGFMGSNVVSGYGTGVIIRTGGHTYFGMLARSIAGRRELSSFDRGINRFTWLMIRFMAVMVPAVFLINGFTKGSWLEAFLFAVAVAVGLTPEMLPMIVTVNLAKGAMAMSGKRVIVKRLQAIQNFGAMDVLCTDKTGTLTQDRIILKRHMDLKGQDSDEVLKYAYLNSYYQSGLKNLLDVAVLDHLDLHGQYGEGSEYRKVDEIPFDFARRRLSVVVSFQGRHILVCKGAVEEMFAASTRYELNGEEGRLDAGHLADANRITAQLNEDGFRVVAVAYKNIPVPKAHYATADECDLTLVGIIAFLDPPKDSAAAAIKALDKVGVQVKILTGDNEIVTRKICRDVGVDAGRLMLGSELEALNDESLAQRVDSTTVFAKLSPQQKSRVIGALHSRGHVVGFLGDGINDSTALKAADVGISVDSAVDIAKECADIILLDKDLMVLESGVLEGRRVFGNITKYIQMGASSNFGNMLSVLGASIFLPFLPMTAIQVLTNNLLYDFSQTAIPTDHVDSEYLAVPRRWEIGNIFKFMVFIGPISSIFDFATFFVLIRFFGGWENAALFQSGWFVESLLTQTLIIHIIRTSRLPFIQSRASAALLATSLSICAIGIALPFTWAGRALGFVTLPAAFFPVLLAFLLGYAVLAHCAKVWFVRRWGM